MYEKQVHKDGVWQVIVTDKEEHVTKYFERHEYKNLFRLNPAGHCEFLERLKEQGRDSTDGHKLYHVGIIGMSSHDAVYAQDAGSEEIDNGDETPTEPREAPFSSPSKATNLTLHATPTKESVDDSKPKAMEVLGKAQRVLRKEETKSPAKLGRKQERFTSPSQGAKKDGGNAVGTDDDPKKSGDQIEKHFQEADRLFSNGRREEAMEVLMDAMDTMYENLGKDQKMQLHSRISSMAHDLQWL